MVLVLKWPFFQLFFLGNKLKKNVFYGILERKNGFLEYKNKKFKKTKKWRFSMVLVKKWLFFQLYFLGNIGQENVLYGILEQKKVFLGYKNNKFKQSKNWHFSKGVNPWFRSKNGHFLHFLCLGIIGQENVFYDILQRQNAFLGYKKMKFK